MLLSEIASVSSIGNSEDKDVQARLDKNKNTKRGHDDIGKKRRAKLSQSDQFRDIARQIRNNPNND